MDTMQIGAVRAFNRLVTRRIGLLDKSFLGRGRPLACARLIYEIGKKGVDLRSLRTRMGLDSGYLSRMIRTLEHEGLATTRSDPRDARRREALLSKKGLDELAQYEQRSNAFARALLEPLDSAQRARLVRAMAEAGRLMRFGSLDIRVTDPASAEAKWCLEQYYRELGRRFDAGFEPARSISASPQELRPPRGIFLLAHSLGEPVGCGALKLKLQHVAEIKRMWVAESARGIGVGRQILHALEAEAARRGVRVLRLETNRTLKEAQRMYLSSGYVEVPAFNNEPYAHHWFEKRLGPTSRPRTRDRRGKLHKSSRFGKSLASRRSSSR